MAKNIVIFSDGTGQLGGVGHNTNVYKLFNCIEDRTQRQISFYDPGIGSRGQEFIKQGTGLGITENIKDCYRFLFDHYEAGDKIFLIGFSRGAATVRSLSGMLHLFGVLPKSRDDLIDEAYEIYKTNNIPKRKLKAKAFIEKHHTMWVKVHFLGVFDTVAALGLGQAKLNRILKKLGIKTDFHDFSLSESVIHARHALAIDEERLAFKPVLWDTKIKSDQTLKQIWFLGVHTDVGGGYQERGLSDISMKWMLDEAEAQGLHIYERSRPSFQPNANEVINEEKYVFWKIRFSAAHRSWPVTTHGVPVIHKTVLERTRGRYGDSIPYKPWILHGPYKVEG